MGPVAGICTHILEYYSIRTFIPGSPSDIGVLMFIFGAIYVLMSLTTILWIKSQEVHAQDGDPEAVKSVIFPVFVKVLWASAIVSIYSGLIICFVPISTLGGNPGWVAGLYASVFTFQHAICEGIAFLLMQKGCGNFAALIALQWTVLWSICTFVVFFIDYYYGGRLGDLVGIVWEIALAIFYFCLWLVPQRRLFRRPAVYLYAKFWAYFRAVVLLISIFYFFPQTEDLGVCGYIFIYAFIYAIVQPLICYLTLLQDSRWWQGIEIDQAGRRGSYEDILSPLIGTDLPLEFAQSLAKTMDQMRDQSVRMLNFACIKLDLNKPLGAGSFSKVYKGTYRNQSCAIKLIYTFDLTATTIKRIAAEASILSSVKHLNVVNIYGVSVLPPSVCLILELCSFGSLSDIIRGHGFDWSTSKKAPMTLSFVDKLFLALGCARGLAAIHSYDSTLCHRDIKSFNFLVDSQFNTKIADLELGLAEINVEDKLVTVEEMLANWMAPEVINNRVYEQPSDVYSLAIVFWEIISGQLPFDRESQPEIRKKIKAGFRHKIPEEYAKTSFARLIVRSWSENPADRPTAKEIASELEVILQECCYKIVSDTSLSIDMSPILNFYEIANHLPSVTSDQPPRTDSYGSRIRQSLSSNALASKLHMSSSNGPQASSFPPGGPKLNMPVHMPQLVQSLLQTIQDHPNWIPFEESGQPWALFTPYPPYLLVFATSSWNYLFGFMNHPTHPTLRSFQDLIKDMSEYKSFLEHQREQRQQLERERKSATTRKSKLAQTLSPRKSANSAFSAHSVGSLPASASAATVANVEIDANYYNAAELFLSQVAEYNEAHGVLPFSRKLGRTIDPFLCSLHAYSIFHDQAHQTIPLEDSFHSTNSSGNSNAMALSALSGLSAATLSSASRPVTHPMSPGRKGGELSNRDSMTLRREASLRSFNNSRTSLESSRFVTEASTSTESPLPLSNVAFIAILFNELKESPTPISPSGGSGGGGGGSAGAGGSSSQSLANSLSGILNWGSKISGHSYTSRYSDSISVSHANSLSAGSSGRVNSHATSASGSSSIPIKSISTNSVAGASNHNLLSIQQVQAIQGAQGAAAVRAHHHSNNSLNQPDSDGQVSTGSNTTSLGSLFSTISSFFLFDSGSGKGGRKHADSTGFGIATAPPADVESQVVTPLPPASKASNSRSNSRNNSPRPGNSESRKSISKPTIDAGSPLLSQLLTENHLGVVNIDVDASSDDEHEPEPEPGQDISIDVDVNMDDNQPQAGARLSGGLEDAEDIFPFQGDNSPHDRRQHQSNSSESSAASDDRLVK